MLDLEALNAAHAIRVGHFSRVFIARWCDLPLEMGYHFSCDAGGLNILGYQHNTLKEPSLIGLNWFSEDRS